MAARNPFPCGNRAITGTGCRSPMVNGIRTDMVNERLGRRALGGAKRY
jgi:hypothetical protein